MIIRQTTERLPTAATDEMKDPRDDPYAAPQSPTEKPRPRRRRVAWLLLEIVVAIAIIGAAIWLMSFGRPP